MVPVYPLAGGATQRRVRELLARVLDRCLRLIEDPLTAAERGDLMPLADALRTVHFPEDAADVRPALDRLAFDELLALQLTLAQARAARAEQLAPAIEVPREQLEAIIGALPFELTGDQRAAVVRDRGRPRGRASRCGACCRGMSGAARRRSRRSRWRQPAAVAGRPR